MCKWSEHWFVFYVSFVVVVFYLRLFWRIILFSSVCYITDACAKYFCLRKIKIDWAADLFCFYFIWKSEELNLMVCRLLLAYISNLVCRILSKFKFDHFDHFWPFLSKNSDSSSNIELKASVEGHTLESEIDIG